MEEVKSMLKVVVCYVHKKYSTHEIGVELHMTRKNVIRMLKKAETVSPKIAALIRRQKKLNQIDGGYRSQETREG